MRHASLGKNLKDKQKQFQLRIRVTEILMFKKIK